MFGISPADPSSANVSFVTKVVAPIATHAGPDLGDIIFQISALFSIIISSTCLALRVKTVRQTTTLRQISTVHVLVVLIMSLALGFVTSAEFIYFGYGIFDEGTCRSAGFICLSFYLCQKYALYLFLVERTHICNALSRPRREDPIYLAGLFFVLVGFTAIGIACFVYLIADYDSVCRIGLHRPVAAALLIWDVFVNVFLTFVFLHHIREFLLEGVAITLCPCFRRWRGSGDWPSSSGLVIRAQQRLAYVIRKTFWASLAILLGTVTNFTILLYYAGHEQAWVCLFACTLDAMWAVIIIFWLTHTNSSLPAKEPSLNQPSLNQPSLRQVDEDTS